MAASTPVPDYVGHLQWFFLRAYVAAFRDPRLTADERLARRMELELFILELGPPMLRHVQTAFHVADLGSGESAEVARWFITFVSGLDDTWLKQSDAIGILETFWSTMNEPRLLRSALELMMMIERAKAQQPQYSRIIILFRAEQPQPFGDPFAPKAQAIINTLISRAVLMPDIPPQARDLAIYGLRVLRFCFVDMRDEIRSGQVDAILQHATQLDPKHEIRIREVLSRSNYSAG